MASRNSSQFTGFSIDDQRIERPRRQSAGSAPRRESIQPATGRGSRLCAPLKAVYGLCGCVAPPKVDFDDFLDRSNPTIASSASASRRPTPAQRNSYVSMATRPVQIASSPFDKRTSALGRDVRGSRRACAEVTVGTYELLVHSSSSSASDDAAHGVPTGSGSQSDAAVEDDGTWAWVGPGQRRSRSANGRRRAVDRPSDDERVQTQKQSNVVLRQGTCASTQCPVDVERDMGFRSAREERASSARQRSVSVSDVIDHPPDNVVGALSRNSVGRSTVTAGSTRCVVPTVSDRPQSTLKASTEKLVGGDKPPVDRDRARHAEVFPVPVDATRIVCGAEVHALDNNVISGSDSSVEAYVAFLRKHSCYNLLPVNVKLVFLDTRLTVNTALFSVLHCQVADVMLWDSDALEIAGLLTIRHFIGALLYLYTESQMRLKRGQNTITLAQYQAACRQPERGNELPVQSLFTDVESSLWDAVETMRQLDVSRLVLKQPIQHNILAVVSADIIFRYFYFNCVLQTASCSAMNISLADCGLSMDRSLAKINMETPLREVLEHLQSTELTSLPVVDDDGKLADVYTSYDITCLVADGLPGILNITVELALRLRKHDVDVEGFLCRLSDSLRIAFDKMIAGDVPGLIIIDSTGRPVGNVSSAELLYALTSCHHRGV